MDIQKGDTINYFRYVYGVQSISKGVVSEVNADGSCVIEKNGKNAIVEKKDIIEIVSKAETPKTETISTETKENSTVSKEDSKKDTDANSNSKKFNPFGGK